MKVRILNTISGLFLIGILSAQTNTGKFIQYNIRDGLSQSTVIDLFQDSKGYMWFGTSDGLNKFDGRNFTIYKNNYKDPNSLSDNSIIKIFLEDSDNNLWLITGDKTINKLNLKTGQITRFSPVANDSNSLPQFQDLYSFDTDINNNIWISTDIGVYKIINNTARVKKYYPLEIYDTTSSKNNVIRSLKDKKGNLWFYSQFGICRYNYKKDAFDYFKNLGFLSDGIYRIMNVDSVQICFLSPSGLSFFNYQTNRFNSFPFPDKFELYHSKMYQAAMLSDKNNNIWIGTLNGLAKFNMGNKGYKLYTHSNTVSGSISDNRITEITSDHTGNIWIGTFSGLNKYNPESDRFSNFYHSIGTNTDDNFIFDIIALKNDEIWVLGQMQHGGSYLSKLNKQTKTLENYKYSNCDPNSIASSFVYRPLIDRDGNLWFGSFSDGAIQYIPRSNKFMHYFHNPNNNKSLAGNDVWGFAEDLSGHIWISLYDKGITEFDTINGTFTNYKPVIKFKNKNLQYTLMNVRTDRNGIIWFASIGAGLIRFDPKNGSYKAFLNDPDKPNSISSNFIHDVYVDKSGKIWIAHRMDGVDIYDPATGIFKNLKNDPSNTNSLSNNSIWAIAEDDQNNIWISTEGYIDCFNQRNKKFTHFKSKSSIDKSLLADKALCIYPDNNGIIWFGTSGGGLSKLNVKTKKFTHYTEIDGLPNNVVYGIIKDKYNNLWLSTNRGISKFDPHKLIFTNYNESAGLQSDEFNQGAYFKSSTNQLYFGGINGFNVFNPGNIVKDTLAPKTILCCMQFSGIIVPVIHPAKRDLINPEHPDRIIKDSLGYYLHTDVSYLKKIEIPYRVKVFTLEFTPNIFNKAQKCRFRYKLENFDTNWNYTVNSNFATYTNLSPGEYTFKVSAANSDGYWNPNPYELQITIIPPFWKTWWFITLEIVLIICAVWFYIKLRVRNLKRSKVILENKVKERTRQIAEKNEELKLRNIEISKQKEEIAFQAKQLKTELVLHNKVSEMALLRAQINPHFLFNTLNNIYSLVNKNAKEAPAAIVKLSEIMRYMLYDANADKVPIEKEINYLKSFIELQLLRIKNKDFIEFNIEGNIYGKSITPMIFIPFIENAFKHGSKKNGNPGIIINLAIDDNKLHFDISNQYQTNGTINKDDTGGIGLENVRRRLELIHPYDHILEISKTDSEFKVILEIQLT